MVDISRIEPLFTIEANAKKLLVIYDRSWHYGIDGNFKSNEEMRSSLHTYFDDILPLIFEDVGDGKTYILNICRTDDFGHFEWNTSFGRSILEEQIEIFEPYIKAFILGTYYQKTGKNEPNSLSRFQ